MRSSGGRTTHNQRYVWRPSEACDGAGWQSGDQDG